MKHFLNIIKIFFFFSIQIVAMILSLIVVPIALLLNRIEDFEPANETSRPNHKFKDKWIDYIWGNGDDGLDGDVYYLKDHVNYKRNFWTRFNWLVLRNPVHNLGLKIGFNDIAKHHQGFRKGFFNSKCQSKEFNNDYINCLDSKKDRQGFEYTIVNNKYSMYRLRLKYPFISYGIKANIGWKNWNVHKIDEYYSYTFTFLINLFKKFD